MQYAAFNSESGVMQIASAGISGPLHLFPGGCRILERSRAAARDVPGCELGNHHATTGAGGCHGVFCGWHY